MAQIRVENLRKEFGSFTAVQASTFTIEDGEFFMLLGPSGCGKTTTLRMMAGLEMASSGQIYIDNREVSKVPAKERDIAFVFQLFALYPHLNVRNNIAYPLRSQGMRREKIRAKVSEIAEILGITDILDKSVSGLSGGDRQRVALGRAIVRNPQAFFMDEPLGALDAEFRERMADELLALHKRMKATTVYVTHDQLEAIQMGDKIVVMNQGVIEQFGVPQDIYDWPASRFVGDFLGSPSMNFLPAEGSVAAGARAIRMDSKPLSIPVQLQGGDQILIGVRPENISLSNEGDVRGMVTNIDYLGTTQVITVKTAVGEIRARIPSALRLHLHETVGLTFATDTISLFEKESERALVSEGNKRVLGHG